MRRFLLLMMVLLFSTAIFAEEGWELVDGILAKVDDKVITLSEVRAERAILRWGGEEDALATGEVVRELVKRALIVSEASKLRLTATEDEVRGELAVLAGAGGPPSLFWKKMADIGFTRVEVEERARAVTLVARYLAFRKETTYVSESDVRKYYSDKADELGEKSLAEARDEVRERLAEEKYSVELKEWVEEQVQRGRVRIMSLPGLND